MVLTCLRRPLLHPFFQSLETLANLAFMTGKGSQLQGKGLADVDKGIRLFLTKLREEKDSDLLYSIRRKSYPNEKGKENSRYLVFFKVDKVLPLIGAGKDPQKVE